MQSDNPYNLKNWEIINGVLGFKSGKGFISPSAEEIFLAIFENKASKDFDETDINALKEIIQFSKYPAILQIILKPINGSNYIDFSINAKCNDGNSAMISWNTDTDHIVIDNVWYPFVPGMKEEVNNIMTSISLPQPGKIRLKQYLSLLNLKNDLIKNEVNQINFNHSTEAFEERLKSINGQLYPYQLKGLQWLRFMHREKIGGILADEMGLGKTLQIIALLSCELKEEVFPSLVVAPATLLENWRREFEKFAPHILTYIHQGPIRTGFPNHLKTFDIIITSYDTIVRDNALFSQIEWSIVICDEAQAIKNPETKRAVSIKKLPRKTGFAVTGTPMENRLMDLWSIMDFSIPGLLGNKFDFESFYETSSDGAAKLESLISPLILRRRVFEVAKDLPAKIIIPQVLNLSEEEIEQYEQIRMDTLKEFRSNSSLVVLTRLRMFCAHPALIFNTDPESPIDYSNKFVRLVEIGQEIVDNSAKMLVFTSFNTMNDIIATDFRKRFGIFTSSIDGRTPTVERQKIVDEFSKTTGPAALVLNPIAAGTGLNITAANHVIHYNLEWNPAKEDQASARAYRRGQDRPVTIHRLFYANTVEEVIDDRLNRKRELAGTAIVGIKGEDDDYNDILKAVNKSSKEKR